MTNFQYHLLHCKLYDNERLMALPVNARWLFVWLWGNRNIDAEGRQVYSLASVKRMCFPFDAVTESDIAGYLQVLQSKRFIQLYRAELEGEMAELVCVPKFAENQRFRPGRMSQSRLPDPDELVLSGETKATAELVAKQTTQLVKPQLPSLLIIETQLDDSVRGAWERLIALMISQRSSGKVAESLQILLIERIAVIRERDDLSWDAIRYGLDAAVTANQGEGIDTKRRPEGIANYVLASARGYRGENAMPEFDPREGVFDY